MRATLFLRGISSHLDVPVNSREDVVAFISMSNLMISAGVADTISVGLLPATDPPLSLFMENTKLGVHTVLTNKLTGQMEAEDLWEKPTTIIPTFSVPMQHGFVLN